MPEHSSLDFDCGVVDRIGCLVKFWWKSILGLFLGFVLIFVLVIIAAIIAGGGWAMIVAAILTIVFGLVWVGLWFYEFYLIYDTNQVIKNSKRWTDQNQEVKKIYSANRAIMISYVLYLLGFTIFILGPVVLILKVYIYFQYRSLRDDV